MKLTICVSSAKYNANVKKEKYATYVLLTLKIAIPEWFVMTAMDLVSDLIFFLRIGGALLLLALTAFYLVYRGELKFNYIKEIDSLNLLYGRSAERGGRVI